MVTTPYKTIEACRICRGGDLVEVIDLGDSALTGCFPRAGEPDAPTAPLTVLRCHECGLVQLKHTVSGEQLYTEEYGYRSSINKTMRDHLGDIADDIYKRAELSNGDVVLDIGCNDGTLLKSYPEQLARFGIDPIATKFRDSYGPGVEVASGYFDASVFERLSQGQKAKAISSIAMFYDLEDPNVFVRDIAASLERNGIWVLEQSYMPRMLELNSYDTICHEHLEYYALSQIDRLVRDAELRVFDVGFNPINGGSFRLYVCRENSDYPSHSDALDDARESESRASLHTLNPYAAFRDRVMRLRNDLHDFVRAEVSKGKRVHIYGASTKGNTILQFCGLDNRLVEAAADRNPEKWGSRTPATAIPIISEEESRAEKPDYYLVLPWHFREEFVVREKKFLDDGGRFIFPLPEMEIVG